MSDVREIRYVAAGDNHYRHVAQIVATSGWHITSPKGTLAEALTDFGLGRCSAIVIEDTQTSPSAAMLFAQLRNPLLYLAPIMIVVDRDRPDDVAAFARHFGFTTILKPVSRMLVVNAFTELTKKIIAPVGRLAGEVAKELISGALGGSEDLSNKLNALCKDPAYVHRVVNAKALIPGFDISSGALQTVSYGVFRGIEAELLRHAKSHSGNLLALMNLACFYADFSMTILARRLMQSAASMAQRFSLANVFLAQLHLMLGEQREAIDVMNRLVQMRYYPELTRYSLAKLYFSTGEPDMARAALTDQGGRFAALKAVWMESK